MAESMTYILCRPSGVPFYIGKGTYKRSIWLKNRNKYCQNIIDKYGVENILIGRFTCSTEKIAFELEKGLIKCFKRMGINLTNMTEGGEGGKHHARKGLFSLEHRQNLSIAASSRVTSEDTKNKLRKICSGSGNPNAKSILETTTNKLFGSAIEAAEYFKLNKVDVRYCARYNSGDSYVNMNRFLQTRLNGLNFEWVGD